MQHSSLQSSRFAVRRKRHRAANLHDCTDGGVPDGDRNVVIRDRTWLSSSDDRVRLICFLESLRLAGSVDKSQPYNPRLYLDRPNRLLLSSLGETRPLVSFPFYVGGFHTGHFYTRRVIHTSGGPAPSLVDFNLRSWPLAPGSHSCAQHFRNSVFSLLALAFFSAKCALA